MKRRDFIKTGLMGTLVTGVAPSALLGSRDCDLTSADILGPYWNENHPYRTLLSHEDEPGTRIFISGLSQPTIVSYQSRVPLWMFGTRMTTDVIPSFKNVMAGIQRMIPIICEDKC